MNAARLLNALVTISLHIKTGGGLPTYIPICPPSSPALLGTCQLGCAPQIRIIKLGAPFSKGKHACSEDQPLEVMKVERE